MILTINELKEHVRVPLEATYDAAALDLEFGDLHYLRKIVVKATADRAEQTVTIEGTLNSQVEHVCNRCLDRVRSEFSKPFEFTYETEGRERIDTTPDLRDLLILDRPDRFICREDCRGMCSQCGTNLNHKSCNCTPQNQQSGTQWESLKRVLKRKQS